MNEAAEGEGNLLTLSEVARRAGVSMATAQRYKKLYQNRIPSEGEGRRQRYPAAAVDVFKDLKGQRSSKLREKTASPSRTAAGDATLLTLSSICKQTGISYPTLQRYVRLFSDRIPHEGEGRKRRYHPEAVAVFRQLRAESRPGRKAKADPGGPGPKLLTLTAISEQTGIAGQTLHRYVKLHGDRIPHEGEGRKRRYHPEAVAVFREIRSWSRRGRKPTVNVENALPGESAAPPERQKAPAAEVREQAVSSAPQAEVEAQPPETQAEVEAQPPETQAEAEVQPPETQAEAEVQPPETQAEAEVQPPETQAEAEAPPPETQAEVEAQPPETRGEVEARLAALEAQVSLVLKKLEEPMTITLMAGR